VTPKQFIRTGFSVHDGDACK